MLELAQDMAPADLTGEQAPGVVMVAKAVLDALDGDRKTRTWIVGGAGDLETVASFGWWCQLAGMDAQAIVDHLERDPPGLRAAIRALST